jgi:hypothetical protein
MKSGLVERGHAKAISLFAISSYINETQSPIYRDNEQGTRPRKVEVDFPTHMHERHLPHHPEIDTTTINTYLMNDAIDISVVDKMMPM